MNAEHPATIIKREKGEHSVRPGDVLAVHRDGQIVALLDVERHNGTLTEHHKSPQPLEIIVARRTWTLEELLERMAKPDAAPAAMKWLADAKAASPAAVDQQV